MRIAICDDEHFHRTNLRAAVEASESLPEIAVLSEFSSGEELLEGHAERPFDIIFLDIEMGGISGLEAGHEIRENDKDVIIIFVTSHQQYVFKSFKTEAFGFIVKPVDNAEVSEVLGRALKKHMDQHYIIDYKWQGKAYALDISDIVYISAFHRRIIFHAKDALYECNGKLDDFERDLSPYGFFRCHQNALVNMRYIKRIEETEISTINGFSVQISARRKQACLRAFNTFVNKYRIRLTHGKPG